GQMRRLGKSLAAGGRDNAVELPAVEPSVIRANAARDAERIGLVGELANLIVGDSSCGKLLANLHGFFGAVEENILQIAARQQDEDAVVAVIQSGNGCCYETAQASALKADDGVIDRGQSDDRVARAPYIGKALPHRRQQMLGHLETADAANAIAGQLNQK